MLKRLLTIITILSMVCSFAAGCSSKPITESSEQQQVDVDLTVLSSTIVYAELNNMLSEPDDYLGKTIKMKGSYCTSYADTVDEYYHFVTILDTTACCTRMVEFVWQGDHTFPNDYPEQDAEIEVTGVLSLYDDDEFGMAFYYLAVDDIVVINS